MTPAQKAAAEKAYEILGEHFDGFVLVTLCEGDHDHEEAKNIYYRGGFCQSLGILAQAHHDMLHGIAAKKEAD